MPERALVFELIGPVQDFEEAAAAAGLEWLLGDQYSPSVDSDEEDSDQDADATDGEPDDEQGLSYLYLTMPSARGLDRLLALWRDYKRNKSPTNDEKPWWAVFGYLNDVRTWSAQDRVDPTLPRYIDFLLEKDPDRPVDVELDFWYRSERERRDKAFETLNQLLDEVDGTLLDTVTIEEIGYQAALVRIPARIAGALAKREGQLADINEVMTIRPQSLYQSDVPTTAVPEVPRLGPLPKSSSTQDCIAALIDGYPLAGHDALDGRIEIVESDVKGAHVPVAFRRHGTAMASLVLHGDMHRPTTIQRKIAVVPVLTASDDNRESTPPGKLPIGIVYRALQALLGGNGEAPKAPNAVLINHSICDEFAPFVRRPTPWAALLDYFSHKFGVLFVVSAGNIQESFKVREHQNAASLAGVPHLEQQAAILNAIERAKGRRGILSPAESVNAITVGALHADKAGPCPAGTMDPFPSIEMTNLCSAVGLGVNRSLKPDLVEHGGRVAALPSNGSDCVMVRGHPTPHLGQLVAVPDPHAGDTRRYARLAGTSNAAALVTRAGLLVAETAESFFKSEGQDWLKRPTRAALLKALLTHGADWGDIGQTLETAFPPQGTTQWHKRRQGISRFLGYGRSNLSRVQGGAENRVTLLADDTIQPDQLHEYRVPLPSAMLGRREVRRIVLTLAWTTPISVTTAMYRGATLKIVDEDGKQCYWKGVGRTDVNQPNSSILDKGSLFHIILEGRSLTRRGVDGRGIFIGVQCRSLHRQFADEKIPYALAVTLEMAQSQRTNIHQEVSQAIRARTKPIRTTARQTSK